MLILRLKRCERALSGGRLDEAVQLLLPADARVHRRGQELLDVLVAKLVERGRGHLAEGRVGPADADWHAAAALAGNTPAVAQLRSSIDAQADARRRASDGQRHARTAVERLVRQGQFTLAGQVARGGDAPDAIVADVAVTRAALDRLVADVSTALGRDDWAGAVDQLVAARSTFPAEPRVQQLKREAAARVAEEAGRLTDAGRLDEAAAVLRRAAALGAGAPEIEALQRGLDQCQRAWQMVRGGRLREAREVLERLAGVRPGARWMASAAEELRRACDAIDAVRGGTLGMLEMADATVAYAAAPAAPAPMAGLLRDVRPVAAAGHGAPVPGASARRFVLHVDGAGSFVVLQGHSFAVGPISASRPVDLPLIAAAGTPTMTVMRCDEDYFLSGGVAVPGKLLVSGDRIAVGPRGRLEFRRPNAASGTAVLRVSGARLPWGGVRDVLLMDREIVLGTSAAAHVRVAGCPSAVILQGTGDGGLLCRADETVVVDGRPCGRSAAVSDGARVAVGGVSFVWRRE